MELLLWGIVIGSGIFSVWFIVCLCQKDGKLRIYYGSTQPDIPSDQYDYSLGLEAYVESTSAMEKRHQGYLDHPETQPTYEKVNWAGWTTGPS